MAKELRANTRCANARRRICSFDLFRSDGLPPAITGERAQATGCFLDNFLDNNRDYLDLISVVAGDLTAFRWNARNAIEILFNDVSKSWSLNAWIQRHLFPALVPEQSIVVQQDYTYFHSYWIAITMEYYREYFERLYPVFGSSMVFLYKRQLPAREFDRDLRTLPLEHKLSLLDDAIDDAPAPVRQVLKCAKAYCRSTMGSRNSREAYWLRWT